VYAGPAATARDVCRTIVAGEPVADRPDERTVVEQAVLSSLAPRDRLDVLHCLVDVVSAA
jgi:hypothetical protein